MPIISVSYKTDIPAFYGEWFMNCLRAGYCRMVNPYNRQAYTVSLTRTDVDGIVFWTKNLGPFLPNLPEVKHRGFPFIVQYTITGYPRELEHAVVDAEKSIEHMQMLANTFGSRVGIWRYDPILLTSLTDEDWHLRNFEMLAAKLQGSTDEVVISFAQIYKKTKRNLSVAACDKGFSWEDPCDETKRRIASAMVKIAAEKGIQLSMCAQRQYLVPGAVDARCIDADRLSDVAGKPVWAKLPGHRKDCGCYASKDIGAYGTCPHGCVYCYAVSSRQKALECFHVHDPQCEFLRFSEAQRESVNREASNGGDDQLPLFD